MEIKIDSGDILQSQSDLAVLGCYEDVSLPAFRCHPAGTR